MKPGSFSSSSSTPNENNNTLTDDKKQNVKYDISTGKVYEELGPCAAASQPTSRPLDTYNPYPVSAVTAGQQTYQSTSYPYGNYMSSFGSPYGPTPTAAAASAYPYDRTSMYSYGAGPKAFVPHSAINLSVKTPELPDSASSLDLSMSDQTGASQQPSSQFASYSQTQGSSPQILDLTRQEAKKVESKQEQTEPVDFSSNTSAYTYTTTSASTMVAGTFSTTETGNSSTTDTLNRYRSTPAVPGTWFF